MSQTQDFVIDVAATFKALYGYVPATVPQMPPSPPFLIDQGVPYSGFNPLCSESGQKYMYGNIPQLKDVLGRGVFMPITITTTDQSTGKITPYYFPYSIMGLKNKKILKETPMVERGGSVIEEISLGAWEISIKGFLINDNNLFPDNQLAMLNKLYTNNNPDTHYYTVQLNSVMSDIFLMPNTNVVITDLDIPQKPKVIGVRDFSFTAIQDGILNLVVTS